MRCFYLHSSLTSFILFVSFASVSCGVDVGGDGDPIYRADGHALVLDRLKSAHKRGAKLGLIIDALCPNGAAEYRPDGTLVDEYCPLHFKLQYIDRKHADIHFKASWWEWLAFWESADATTEIVPKCMTQGLQPPREECFDEAGKVPNENTLFSPAHRVFISDVEATVEHTDHGPYMPLAGEEGMYVNTCFPQPTARFKGATIQNIRHDITSMSRQELHDKYYDAPYWCTISLANEIALVDRPSSAHVAWMQQAFKVTHLVIGAVVQGVAIAAGGAALEVALAGVISEEAAGWVVFLGNEAYSAYGAHQALLGLINGASRVFACRDEACRIDAATDAAISFIGVGAWAVAKSSQAQEAIGRGKVAAALHWARNRYAAFTASDLTEPEAVEMTSLLRGQDQRVNTMSYGAMHETYLGHVSEMNPAEQEVYLRAISQTRDVAHLNAWQRAYGETLHNYLGVDKDNLHFKPRSSFWTKWGTNLTAAWRNCVYKGLRCFKSYMSHELDQHVDKQWDTHLGDIPSDQWIFVDTTTIAFSAEGPIDRMSCVSLNEGNDRGGGWWNNYICAFPDIGLQWRTAGSGECQMAVKVQESTEPSETTWHDNYLCYDGDRELRMEWSSAGPMLDNVRHNVRWYEPFDEDTWHDNYLVVRIAGERLNVPVDAR